MSEAAATGTLQRWRQNPISFIEQILRNPKDGQPFKLFEAQRQFFKYAWQTGDDGRLLYPEQCIGWIKKTGKTATAAMHGLTTLLVYGGRYAEAYCIANDYEQAQGRVFTTMRQIVKSSPLLRDEVAITQDRLTFKQTGAFVQALTANHASAAGAHPCWSSVDEAWGVTSERSRRLFDELVPVPTVPISVRLVTTHAGYAGESMLLEEMYARGMALPEIEPDLHAGNHILFTWRHEPLAEWQNDAWLAEMRAITRPIQYVRQFENRFVAAENPFISLEAWDRCVDPHLSMTPVDLFLPIWVGVDASTKRDSTAIVAVSYDQNTHKVRLVNYRIFQPSVTAPLDFELTVEATLRDLAKRFQIRAIRFDPYQLAAVMQRLASDGMVVEEYPQTPDRLTAMAQNLYDLVAGTALRTYPSEQIRTAISRTVASESGRGWKLDKTKQSHKIDVVIALALAAHSAVQAHIQGSFDRSWSFVDGMPIGAAALTDEQRAAQRREEANEFYRARLMNYLARHGAFGAPWGRL